MSLLAFILGAVVVGSSSVNLPISARTPQARAAFEQGLFLYYAYDGEDAARSFDRALALDPQLAIAAWGAALADGPDLNTPPTEDRFARAQAAIARAAGLESNASPLERALIAAMRRRYAGDFGDWPRDDAAYRDAMLALAKTTDDENVKLVTAEALLEHGGLTWTGTALASAESREALALVSDVLLSDPTSVMANHLCIHLYDLAPDRTPALPCAQRLDATAFTPQAEHLAHMPAHYWIETGNYSAALGSSERAHTLLKQLETTGTNPEYVDRYAKHDVAVGYSAAMMLDSYPVALTWATRMQEAYDLRFDALTALRYGQYAAAYDAGSGEFAGESVRGLAALHLGKLHEAHAIAAKLGVTAKTPGYLPQFFLARLAQADGDATAAARWTAQAEENERAEFAGELIPFVSLDRL